MGLVSALQHCELAVNTHTSLLELPSHCFNKRDDEVIWWLIVGFPRGSDGKEPICNAGDPGLIPGFGRSAGEGNGQPLQYSCLENSKDRGAWWPTVHGVAELVVAEWLTHFLSGDFMSLNILFLIYWIFIFCTDTEFYCKSFEFCNFTPARWYSKEVLMK